MDNTTERENNNDTFILDLRKIADFMEGSSKIGQTMISELSINELKDIILTCGLISMNVTQLAVTMAGVMKYLSPNDFKVFKLELLKMDKDENPAFGDDDDNDSDNPF